MAIPQIAKFGRDDQCSSLVAAVSKNKISREEGEPVRAQPTSTLEGVNEKQTSPQRLSEEREVQQAQLQSILLRRTPRSAVPHSTTQSAKGEEDRWARPTAGKEWHRRSISLLLPKRVNTSHAPGRYKMRVGRIPTQSRKGGKWARPTCQDEVERAQSASPLFAAVSRASRG